MANVETPPLTAATIQTTASRPAPEPAALTAAEIAALALSLAHLGAGPQSATARRALRHAFDHLDPGDEVVATTLSTLTAPLDPDTARRARTAAIAITGRLVLRLRYRDAAGRLTVREVEPVTCLVHRDHWYLVSWCRSARAIRAFRFDRMIALEPTDTPARAHLATRYLPFQRRRRVAA
ncbi:WYL domain-containing protein [Bailinhaonella thermotolerans]|uniref:WYL domain-containing protein n=1 Tax=Bailinhaonella thermotolerans TaxID=1070861 RepID=A0A3A4BH29_9ACTN|nr:WYL domain-containing protein [Bailinhaonella thermotolerans]RJL34072.1 WYL domain-containing protein [Bailinhaonella thermotolerans]